MTGKQRIVRFLNRMRFAPGDVEALLDEGLLMLPGPYQTHIYPQAWSPAGLAIIDELLEAKRVCYMVDTSEPPEVSAAEADRMQAEVENDLHGGTGEGSHNAKLTDAIVVEIIERRENGETLDQISRRYGISICLASQVSLGKRWGHVRGNK